MLELGLADISWKNFDPSFLFKAFLARFVAWPIAVALFIVALRLDADGDFFRALALVAFLPMAANGVVIATELKTSLSKIAGAIAVSTAVSLVLVNLHVHIKFIHAIVELSG